MPSADQLPPVQAADALAGQRLFVSYTTADRAWAEWIAWQLEDAGYQVTLDVWDFAPGEHFIQRMNQALADADRVVAVLSPAYLTATYAAEEWWAALLRGRGESARLLPLRVALCELPPLLAGRIYIDVVEVDEPEAIRRLREGAAASVRGTRPKPEVAPDFPGRLGAGHQAPQPPWPGHGPAISNLPARNLHFTGRAELLAALEERLAAGGAAALVAAHGLGGVGKSQLALEYAHRHAGDFDLIWWISVDTSSAAVTGMSALAPRLGLEVEADMEATAAKVAEVLAGREGWLLIFDNAEDPDAIARLLPGGGGGRVLITSRNPAFGQLGAKLEVEVWPPGVAADFLLERTGQDDRPAAEALAEALGGLPLALAQAAAYCEQTSLDLAEYLARYHRRQKELLGRPERALVNYPATVATTWKLNLDELAADQPAAVELLRLCAFLAPDAIPLELLTAAPEELPDGLAGVVTDELALDAAMAGLYRFSLIRRDRTGLGVHRLVQAVVRDHLTRLQARQWARCAVGLLCEVLPEQPNKPPNWPQAEILMAHAQAAADHAQACNAAPEDTARLLDRVGVYLWSRGALVAARSSLERALAIGEAALGPEHPWVAIILGNLGLAVHSQGELTVAREHLERALAIKEAVFGPDDAEVAVALANLGLELQEVGELGAAREHLERALAIKEAVYGREHPEVAATLSGLGDVLHDQGELTVAREHLERALAIREAVFGPDDAEVAVALTNLGNVLHDQGELTVAREHLGRALAIAEAVFGPEHSEVAVTLTNLGNVLRDQGELNAAREYLVRALAIKEAVFGPEHSGVAVTLTNLGNVLRDQGELTVAREHLERALGIFRRTLGPDHSRTQKAERLLGYLGNDG